MTDRPVDEKRRGKFVDRIMRLLEREWDRQKLTPIQREQRLRKAEKLIEQIKEKRRGH